MGNFKESVTNFLLSKTKLKSQDGWQLWLLITARKMFILHILHYQLFQNNWNCNKYAKYTHRTHDAKITSLWRQNDAATAFWCHNEVIIAFCVRWVQFLILPWAFMTNDNSTSEEKLDMSTARRRLKSPHSLYGTSTHPTMVTHRSQSWSWMIDSHPFHSMSISPPFLK